MIIEVNVEHNLVDFVYVEEDLAEMHPDQVSKPSINREQPCQVEIEVHHAVWCHEPCCGVDVDGCGVGLYGFWEGDGYVGISYSGEPYFCAEFVRCVIVP